MSKKSTNRMNELSDLRKLQSLMQLIINFDTSKILFSFNSLLYRGYITINRNVTPSSSYYDLIYFWATEQLYNPLSKENITYLDIKLAKFCFEFK